MAKDPLETYRKKRDFRKTGEPSGKGRRKAGKGRRKPGPRFVIQKHAAGRSTTTSGSRPTAS